MPLLFFRITSAGVQITSPRNRSIPLIAIQDAQVSTPNGVATEMMASTATSRYLLDPRLGPLVIPAIRRLEHLQHRLVHVGVHPAPPLPPLLPGPRPLPW